jgi:hypothetical protein
MIALPEKPWAEGATFTNDETGVKYTFDGEKWLAGGGAEADDATLALINEVDRTSQMRDEVLDGKIDEESAKNTVVHLKLEDQILRYYAWSVGDNEKLEKELQAADAELQKQIDENKDASESGDRQLQSEIDQVALALETLLVQREHGQWKYVGFSGDNIPRNAGEFALISDDLSATDNIITLNQEDLKGTTHGFGDVEVGDYVEIVDYDEPGSYALFVVKKAPEGSGIVNVEVSLKDKGQNILIGETCEIRFFQVNEQDINLTDLDNRYLKLSGGEMAPSATLKVNTLEPVNTPMIQYNGDPDSTHAAGLINREMMRRYVAEELGKAPQSSSPMSAKLMVGFQLWSEGRLAEGCFNLLDENKNPTSKIKSARFLTFHIIQGWDHADWFKYDLRGKGQIHLTDLDGKYQMSKFVMGAEKHDAATGTDPAGALWFFELEEYGHDPDLTLSGTYFIEFDSCLKEPSS